MGGEEWALAERPADVITRENPLLDAPILDAPVLDAPVLDAVAAGAFRVAAVKLAREQPQTDTANEAAREAAQALLILAASHDEAALRQILRPDPRVDEAAWTVACYQIGDLTPCALLDFANPVAAVTTLAHCGEASHVAAELVASTPSGSRWTALTRTGALVRFQLPDGRSASDATREGPAAPSLADGHWRDQLRRWAADRGAPDAVGDSVIRGPEGRSNPPVDPDPWSRRSPSSEYDTTVTASRPRAAVAAAPVSYRPMAPALVPAPAPAPAPRESAGLEQALELVLQALRSVEVRSQAVGPQGEEIVHRLDDLDRRMSEFQASIGSALERRMAALATYSVELARGFAAQQNATAARLEARFDELMARLATVAETP